MNLDSLVEGEREDELLVTVRLKESSPRGQTVAIRMVIVFIEALGPTLVNEGRKVHHALDPDLLRLAPLVSIVLLDHILECLVVSALHLVNLYFVPEHHEGGHGINSVSCSCLLALVNINLKTKNKTILKDIPHDSHTFMNTALGYLEDSSSKKGEILLQGPHQDAVKSTATSLVPAEASSVWKWASSWITVTLVMVSLGSSVTHIMAHIMLTLYTHTKVYHYIFTVIQHLYFLNVTGLVLSCI